MTIWGKLKTVGIIALAIICAALVWLQDTLVGALRNSMPSLVCVLGGYFAHLMFETDGLVSFIFATGAIVLWAGALQVVEVRTKAEAFQRGANMVADAMIKAMQEQKRP